MIGAGTRLGPYEVLSPLGAGGMGEVYRARDTSLERRVALKVLPEEFFEDRERVARFEREAKALAALNHPAIAAVHSFEAVSGRHILVMELVEGESLDAKIATGPIPLDEALPIARQIAEGLEAAHEKGIIHRDLKPANVMVGSDGRVKLLDFGLAKALEGDAASQGSSSLTHSPTLTGHATAAGVILGTAAYMSPEQARGKAVDRRADIWAFGAVFYEMLTARRLFEGDTVTDVLAGVLRQDIDFEALPRDTPPGIRKLVRRCLERDPRNRLHDAGDARLEIEEALRSPAAGRTAAVVSSRERPAVLRSLPWLIAALMAALAIAVSLGQRRPTAVAGDPVRLSFSMTDGLTVVPTSRGRLRFSRSPPTGSARPSAPGRARRVGSTFAISPGRTPSRSPGRKTAGISSSPPTGSGSVSTRRGSSRRRRCAAALPSSWRPRSSRVDRPGETTG